MISIALFNNKGGVGTTSLAYHLAWMFADRGLSVVAADLDPQANLTGMFIDEDRLEALWPKSMHPNTIQGVVEPIIRGVGDIAAPHLVEVSPNLALLPGDLELARFEDKLSESWPKCHNRDEASFRATSAFHRATVQAADQRSADLVLIDVGPNLGAINRAALIAADFVIIPLIPDLFSLQGLRNVGPRLIEWRRSWQEMIPKNPNPSELRLPPGDMKPVGYVTMQHAVRVDRPVKAYLKWMNRIPAEYAESVLEQTPMPLVHPDPNCLATLKHYRSLMPMAMEARKPIFSLKPADGALGAHLAAVADCRQDFMTLTSKIAQVCGFQV